MARARSKRTVATEHKIARMAKLVRDTRLSLDETQPEFAARIGATQSSVSRWEIGEAAPGGEYIIDILTIGLTQGTFELQEIVAPA